MIKTLPHTSRITGALILTFFVGSVCKTKPYQKITMGKKTQLTVIELLEKSRKRWETNVYCMTCLTFDFHFLHCVCATHQGFRTLDDIRTKAHLTNSQKIGLKHYDDFLDRMPREEAAAIEKVVMHLNWLHICMWHLQLIAEIRFLLSTIENVKSCM